MGRVQGSFPTETPRGREKAEIGACKGERWRMIPVRSRMRSSITTATHQLWSMPLKDSHPHKKCLLRTVIAQENPPWIGLSCDFCLVPNEEGKMEDVTNNHYPTFAGLTDVQIQECSTGMGETPHKWARLGEQTRELCTGMVGAPHIVHSRCTDL